MVVSEGQQRGSTIGEGGDTTISSPGRSPKQPLPGMRLPDPLHGRQAAPNLSHLTRGLLKYVPGRGYFRAVPSQNGDKYVTSPPRPPIVELVSSSSPLSLRASRPWAPRILLPLLLTCPFSLLPVRALASIHTNSCSCLGTSSTALSKLVQNVCLLLAFCFSVGAYATKPSRPWPDHVIQV